MPSLLKSPQPYYHRPLTVVARRIAEKAGQRQAFSFQELYRCARRYKPPIHSLIPTTFTALRRFIPRKATAVSARFALSTIYADTRPYGVCEQ